MKLFLKRLLTNRMFIGGVLLITQFTIVVYLILKASLRGFLGDLFVIVSIVMVTWIIRKDDNPAYKIPWIIAIMLFPLFGGIFYLVWGNTPLNRAKLVRIGSLKTHPAKDILYPNNEFCIKQYPKFKNHVNYINNIAQLPACKNTEITYFSEGEKQFNSLLIELKKAKKFIFLEYFIIEEGVMWNSILEILIEKVKEGVEVRVMYDDAGCMQYLPKHYFKFLQENGIKAQAFNRFRPALNTYLNYRDHRKICVIDGITGYMGGLNLADEYINRKQKFGYWKDTAFMLHGDAVNNLTLMFLQLWEFTSKKISENYDIYKSHSIVENDNLCQPFCDGPLDNHNMCETIYMRIINNAQKYVYITTPYLILDNEMVTALTTAAVSGIDVRIITPSIPDKWYVHTVTRSFYTTLIEAGVKIYEYTPGFIHSKMIVSDDEVAVVGTINMDFRSFYMHFECGTIFYNSQIMQDIKEDILSIIDVSEYITRSWLDKNNTYIKGMAASILRVFSPMM